MYKNFILVICSIMISSCAQYKIVEQITLPNGKQGFTVDCSNTGWPDCFKEAGNTCQNGYEIHERTKEKNIETKVPLTELKDSAISGSSMPMPRPYPIQQRAKYMVLSCK